MWGKTNDTGSKALTLTPTPTVPATPSSERTQPAIAAPSKISASVGKTTQVKGDIYSEEELFFDGELEGSIEVRQLLTIGPNGKVKANVKARELIVKGSIHGDVEASDRISIMNGATIIGDVKTAGIVIEDGAYFKGGIDILRPENGKKPEPLSAVAKGA